MIAISERTVLRKATVRLVPFLFVLYIVAYIDRVNVGFAQLQMSRDLRFSNGVYGLGAGIFFIGYFLFEVPSNLILERVGARRWIARIMATWGVVAMAMLFTRSPASFYTLRFLLGLAEAGFFPGIILYLTYWFTAAERARIVALFMTATQASGVIGGPLAGALLRIHGNGLAGWQWLYLLEGIPAILLAGVVLSYLPDGPETARWLTEEEQNWLVHRLDAERRLRAEDSHHHFREAIANPQVWMLSLLYFTIAMSSYGITMWLPVLVKGFSGLSDLQVGLLTAVPYAAASVGMVLNGIHSDRTGERKAHIALPAFLGAIGFLLTATLHQPVFLICALALAATGISSTLGPFWALPTAFLRGTAAAGGIAFINSVGNLGGFVGPFLVGYVKEQTQSFAGGLYVLCGALVLGGILALGAPHRRDGACGV